MSFSDSNSGLATWPQQSLGMAQKLFIERTAQSQESGDLLPPQWPLLQKMAAQGRLGYVDLALAEQLLGDEGNEADAALLCHLSMASRLGHLCIKIENETVYPPLEEIWNADDVYATPEEDALLLGKILQGAEKGGSSSVIQNSGCFYLHRNWHLETMLLAYLKAFLEQAQVLPLSTQTIESAVEALAKGKKLLKEQVSAILAAVESPLLFITGGPGTGKTYTAGILLKTFWESFSRLNGAHLKVALAAPTGKAAANLEASIKAAVKDSPGLPAITAQTLHQLLGVKKSGSLNEPAPLDADLVLVDESSMIDIGLMGRLFASLKPGARLILLGDRHQLPSVEGGSLFADLIEYFLSCPGEKGRVVELKTCLRAELKSIIDIAERIKAGDRASAIQIFQHEPEGVSFVALEEGAPFHEIQRRLIEGVVSYFPSVKAIPKNPLELLERYLHFRILTTKRRGPLGVDALNAAIYKASAARMQSGFFVAPIMVMQNDYLLGLFNGEGGILIREVDDEYALFPSRVAGKSFRKIPLLLMPQFEYAYCISVHKSQGSEFDHVLLLLPEGAERFGREALYTGATRAKKHLEIWSRKETISRMIHSPAHRLSGILDRMDYKF